MFKVLSIQYEDGSDALLVRLGEFRESEHVEGTFVRQIGAAEPLVRIALADLPQDVASTFASLLDALPALATAKHDELASDPAKLAEAASQLAQREQALALTETAKRAELEALDAQIAELRAVAAEAAASGVTRPPEV